MIRRMYDWCVAAAYRPAAAWIMGIVSFIESSFFPIPPDAMLIPMSLARPNRAYVYAFICTWTSVAGAVFGYAIGALLFDSVGQWVISAYGLSDKVEVFVGQYTRWGAWIILLAGFTPIPYKLITITSGFAGYNLVLFVVFSIIARGARFYLVAFLLHRYGDRARAMIEQRLELLTAIAAVLGVAGLAFAMYRF
ncbi:YqaA family protein [Pseudorhodoplanes sp.]|uniref:YqaA family protein n=1 Tax=Pseudorhodoplanes sp. TaxID=1934341 RepID=UPI00391ABA67